MLIQIKALNKENLRHQNPTSESCKNFELCNNLEKQDNECRRQIQKESFQESIAEQVKRKQNLQSHLLEEKRKYNERIEESLNLEQKELELKKELRLREVNECKHQYDDYMLRKQQQQFQEVKSNKDFGQQELALREKMERENKEFMNRIKYQRKRYEQVLDCYENLKISNDKRSQSIDNIFVQKGFLEKETKELERERIDLENRKNTKNDVTKTLQQQIENNRIKKEFLKYEDLRIENEILKHITFSVADQNHKKSIERQQQVLTLMRTLDKQIKEREQNLLGCNTLTPFEEDYHCTIKTSEGKVVCPEKVVEAIPGFAVQQDLIKMNTICDNSMIMTHKYLQNELNKINETAKFEKNHSTKITNRKAHQSSEILNKTRSQFSNEYEFLKYKKWHQNFNIISNKAYL